MSSINDIQTFRNIAKLSAFRSLAFVSIGLMVLLFYFYPVSFPSDVFIVLLFGIIYIMISIKHFQEQLRVWKDVVRYRFMSWYYISFSVTWMVVLLALSVLSYFLLHYFAFALALIIVFLVDTIGFYFTYRNAMHFIAVRPNYLIIVKRKINMITPDDIADVYYRNDILIFSMKNERTYFINFDEVSKAKQLKWELSEWFIRNNLNFDDIIKRWF